MSAVVVVLPWVPVTTTERLPRIKKSRSTSGSDRYGIRRERTASASGLPRETALPMTTKSGGGTR